MSNNSKNIVLGDSMVEVCYATNLNKTLRSAFIETTTTKVHWFVIEELDPECIFNEMAIVFQDSVIGTLD